MSRIRDRVRGSVAQFGGNLRNSARNLASNAGQTVRNTASNVRNSNFVRAGSETASDLWSTSSQIWSSSVEILRNRNEPYLTQEQIQERLDEIEDHTLIGIIRGTTTTGAQFPNIMDFLLMGTPIGGNALARELEPHLRRMQVRVDANRHNHSVVNQLFQNTLSEARGFESRTAVQVYRLGIPGVSDFFGAMFNERSDGAQTNPASVAGSVLGGLRNTADNMLTGVMALVTEPDRTLMNAAVGITTFQARPSESSRNFAAQIVHTWENSSVDGRIAGLTELVANVYLMLKGIKPKDYRVTTYRSSGGNLQALYANSPQSTFVGALWRNRGFGFWRDRGRFGFVFRGSSAGSGASGAAVAGSGASSVAGAASGAVGNFLPSLRVFNPPALRPEAAVGAAGSGVNFSGPVKSLVRMAIAQFLEAARRGVTLPPLRLPRLLPGADGFSGDIPIPEPVPTPALPEGSGNSEAWKAIDEFRIQRGLEPLGDRIPSRGDGLDTVAFVEFNGERIFGINSSRLSELEKDLGRDFFRRMRANYFPSTSRYGQGATQVLTHAEAHALMQAFEEAKKIGQSLGAEVTLFVDRMTCPNCKVYLPKVMEYMGIERLTIITKQGVTIVLP